MSKCNLCGGDTFTKSDVDWVIGKLERVGSKVRMDDRNLLPVRVEMCNKCKRLDLFSIADEFNQH